MGAKSKVHKAKEFVANIDFGKMDQRAVKAWGRFDARSNLTTPTTVSVGGTQSKTADHERKRFMKAGGK